MPTAPLAPTAAIACELALATDVGAAILSEGGSAVDAVIAAALVVDVVNSYHSGIGGGGFALVRGKDGQYDTVDFRVAAPEAADPALFTADGATTTGGLAVAVPGQLRGFEALHARHGKLPWKRLFEPSIVLARDGFAVTSDLARTLRLYTIPPGKTEAESWIHDWPALADLFAPNGTLVSEGDLLTRPNFAATLELLAQGGADAFYEGELAEGMVRACQEQGGVLTVDDLRAYKVRHRAAVSTNYKGRKVVSVPAPASGACLIFALNILSNFDAAHGPNSVGDSHRLAEALKFMYVRRTDLGDPDVVEGVQEVEAALVSEGLGKTCHSLISETATHPTEFYSQSQFATKEDSGTSHFVATDRDGLTISMTTTITLWWGSRIMVPSSGIVLNDGMEDFSSAGNHWGYEYAPANAIAPRKRTLSSQCPFIIENEDGSVGYAGGAAGGSKIISTNVQQARNFLDYGINAREALRHPRVHNQLTPDVTLVEASAPADTAAGLAALGHSVISVDPFPSTACAISFTADQGWVASGEPRYENAKGLVVTF